MMGNAFPRVLGPLVLAVIVSGCAQTPWSWPGGSAGSSGWGSLFGGGGGGEQALPENVLALARLSERRGQDEQAERLYEEILRRSPHNPVPHHRLAVMQTRRGRWKEAEAHFARAMALKPDDPDLLADLGYLHYLSGRLDEAEKHLRRAVEIEPNHARYCNNLALVLGELGRDEESLALFRRVNPPSQASLNYAFVLAQRGEYQRSMDLYSQLLTEDQTLRVAADAMIELAKYTPGRWSHTPPPAAPIGPHHGYAAAPHLTGPRHLPQTSHDGAGYPSTHSPAASPPRTAGRPQEGLAVTRAPAPGSYPAAPPSAPAVVRLPSTANRGPMQSEW